MLKVHDIRPVFNRVLTTANKYKEQQYTEGGLIDGTHLEGTAKEYQTVIKVGSAVREVKPGDVVLIDPTRYIKRRYSKDSIQNDLDNNPIISIEIPTVEMDGVDYFMIDDRDILYVITDSDEVEEEQKASIITPKEQKLIIP